MNAIVRSFCIVCGIPTLIAAVYFGAIASDIYVSESRFSIRSSNSGGSGGGIAAFLASPIISAGGQDMMVIADYVKSQDMLSRVQNHMNLRAHYASNEIDALARLKEDATSEELLEYFSRQVVLLHDSSSDVLTLRIHAFDAKFSQELASLVIDLSEDLVNRMSNRIEADALSVAKNEVERLGEKLHLANQNLRGFRNENQSLNPAAESTALMGLLSGIEQQLLEVRTELTEKGAFMRNDAPTMVSLRNREKALHRQLQLEKGKVAGESDGAEWSGLIDAYQPLVLDQELAQQQYASALTSLEVARMEAQRKKQYLVTFIQPNLPDEAVEPRRFYQVLTVFFSAFIAYLIGGLMWSALRDHMRI